MGRINDVAPLKSRLPRTDECSACSVVEAHLIMGRCSRLALFEIPTRAGRAFQQRHEILKPSRNQVLHLAFVLPSTVHSQNSRMQHLLALRVTKQFPGDDLLPRRARPRVR